VNRLNGFGGLGDISGLGGVNGINGMGLGRTLSTPMMQNGENKEGSALADEFSK
jgi:hypothetical protein